MAKKKTAEVAAATPAPAPAAAPEKSEIKGSGTAVKATKPSAIAETKPRSPIVLTHETISKRAFEIYAGRGYASGNPDEDWREAERQLSAGL